MRKLTFCAILMSLLFIPLVTHADTYTTTILDKKVGETDFSYWGGSVNSNSYANRDVIGDPFFSVEQMVVEQTGNLWTVTITGPYFNYRNTGDDNGLPAYLQPGDLYISSTGYSAVGVGPYYPTDTFLSTEPWDYIVPISPTGAASGLYSLDFDGIAMTNVGSLTGNYVYRTDQAWQGGDSGPSLGDASYQYLNDSLIFTFDATNLDFTSGTVGFHWTMQCGNDVLEGAVPARDVPSAPEPSTLLLLGLGLTGVVAYKKIRS